jgi:soluble lytic murein transglycosylase-like protein
VNKEELQKIAVAAALNAGLDPALMCALIAHESAGWKQYAVRYESGFYARYIDSMKGLNPTEKTLRATSFGLCQIMGQTARELGFGGDYLTELLDPLENCKFGCRKLKACLDNEGQDVRRALLRYNGGGNAHYPDLVLIHYKDYAYLNASKS